MIIEIKSDVGKIEKGVANMSRLIIWVLRFEIHSDFLSASMTHCKIGVNLGCTRCEKSSFINVFHITITYSFSFFITISEKINAKSQKNRILLIIFDSYPIKIL